MGKQIIWDDPATHAHYPALYCRIDVILANYRSSTIVCTLGWYADEKAADDGAEPVKRDDVVRSGDDAKPFFELVDKLRGMFYDGLSDLDQYKEAVNTFEDGQNVTAPSAKPGG